MSKGVVLSFFDESGIQLEPWAKAGYECHCVDLLMPPPQVAYLKKKGITGWPMDVYEWEKKVLPKIDVRRVRFMSFFPPCTVLTTSGAHSWQGGNSKKKKSSKFNKVAKDPYFQHKAMDLVYWSKHMGELVNNAAGHDVPYCIENPNRATAISTLWRSSDFNFEPFDYSGYVRDKGDCYVKRTGLWTGGGFRMPRKKRQHCDPSETYIPQMPKNPKYDLLGNDITYLWRIGTPYEVSVENRRGILRSKTPRGWAKAVFMMLSKAKLRTRSVRVHDVRTAQFRKFYEREDPNGPPPVFGLPSRAYHGGETAVSEAFLRAKRSRDTYWWFQKPPGLVRREMADQLRSGREYDVFNRHDV